MASSGAFMTECIVCARFRGIQIGSLPASFQMSMSKVAFILFLRFTMVSLFQGPSQWGGGEGHEAVATPSKSKDLWLRFQLNMFWIKKEVDIAKDNSS